MFKQSTQEAYQARSQAGVRHLFGLGPYEFHDTINDDGHFHHFILETGSTDESVYEVDRETMYEFMARFLAGEYEIDEYELEHSPGHDALLDVLELATARARSGESDFSWEEFDPGAMEVMEEGEDDEDENPA